MATNDKNDLLIQIATLIADNTSGDISPADVRTVLSAMVTADLNLEELTQQTSNGPVNFAGGLQSGGVDVFVANKAIFINSIADLPTAVAGVITLDANMTYVQGNSLNIGTDRFLMSANTVWRGFESLNVSLTYTGTGAVFTMVNTSNRVDKVFVNAASGSLFDWSSTSGEQLRVTDVQSSSAEYGVFTGVNSILRFTNISPVFSVNGLDFNGTWASVLWEVSGAGALAGNFFNLGTATFNSFLVDKTLMTLGAGVSFIDGLPNSGNIQAGGLGTVLLTRISGAGTPLTGVSPDDALWEFFHNDEIADTRPDLLLSMQGNAVQTVIASPSTDGSNAVLAAGIWTEIEGSQMTGTAAGRSTYDGGKDAKLPVTYSVSVAPITGNDVAISVYVAINGVVDINSRRQGSTSSGDPTSITVPWQASFANGEYHEVFIENNSTSANIIVSSAISRTN